MRRRKRPNTVRALALTVAGLQVLAVLAWSVGIVPPTWLAASVMGSAFVAAVIAVSRPRPAPSELVSLHVDGDVWSAFERELARARRYKRSLALIRGPIPGGTRLTPPHELLTRVGESLRAVDTVWVQDEALWLLIPEADHEVAARVAERLAATDAIQPEAIRIASFPLDALTAGALISMVQRNQTGPIHLPVRSAVEAGDGVAAGGSEARFGEGRP